MRSHAKASSAGPTAGRVRLALLAAIAAAFLLVPVSQAAADATLSVSGAGTGTGTVTSDKGSPTINCSIAAGATSGVCSANNIPEDFGETTITAIPGSGSYFVGWTASAGGCSATNSPCKVFTGFGGVFNLTARFDVLPDPPIATTGPAAPGPNDLLISLSGVVNPNGFKVDTCRFEYDTRPYEQGEERHGASVPCVPSAAALGQGSADVPVGATVEVEELTPETTYHYRLIAASNLGGKDEGEADTFATGPAPPLSGCANDAIRATQSFGAMFLPECMALEQVSPARKSSQLARVPSISADGERVAFKATGAFAETPSFNNPLATYYLSSRTGSGWVTSPTGAEPEIVNGAKEFSQPTTYTPDFSRWLTIGSTDLQFPQGIARAYSDGLQAPFEPISPPLVPIASTPVTHNVVWNTAFKGVSADHSRLYFSPGDTVAKTEVAYQPADPEPRGADRHLYLAGLDSAGNPSLQLATRDSVGKVWGERCGARLGGAGKATAPTGRNQGAISVDGDRVYLSTRPTQPAGKVCSSAEHKLRILKRLETSDGPWISELIANECDRPTPACSNADGDDTYEAASLDQTKVYFTTNRQLTDSDVDPTNEECSDELAKAGCDLYLYDTTKPAGERLTQVSAGQDASPGAGAKVFREITGVSTDGSHAYFVAAGVLTTDPNPHGQSPVEGQPNLYVWDAQTQDTAFLGTLNSGDTGFLWGRAGAFINNAWPVPAKGTDSKGNEIGGEGNVLLFITKAALAPQDADGARLDVYRYDGEGSGPEALLCVSCRPGGPDSEAFDVNGRDRGSGLGVADEIGTDLAEARRWASEDGEAVVFTTGVGLVPGDADGASDSYLWRGGELHRLPGNAAGPSVSADGAEVAFSTFAALVPFDVDTASDIYVARAEGGFAVPVPPTPCQGEGCQEPFGPQPGDQGAVTEAPRAGNVTELPKCRKGFVRRRGNCVKRSSRQKKAAHKKKAKQQRTEQRDANTDRRAAK